MRRVFGGETPGERYERTASMVEYRAKRKMHKYITPLVQAREAGGRKLMDDCSLKGKVAAFAFELGMMAESAVERQRKLDGSAAERLTFVRPRKSLHRRTETTKLEGAERGAKIL